MKFTAAVSLLAAVGTVSAFTSQHAAYAGRASSTTIISQNMAATETPVYTFEKSEEIFAEAQEVGNGFLFY